MEGEANIQTEPGPWVKNRQISAQTSGLLFVRYALGTVVKKGLEGSRVETEGLVRMHL